MRIKRNLNNRFVNDRAGSGGVPYCVRSIAIGGQCRAAQYQPGQAPLNRSTKINGMLRILISPVYSL